MVHRRNIVRLDKKQVHFTISQLQLSIEPGLGEVLARLQSTVAPACLIDALFAPNGRIINHSNLDIILSFGCYGPQLLLLLALSGGDRDLNLHTSLDINDDLLDDFGWRIQTV